VDRALPSGRAGGPVGPEPLGASQPQALIPSADAALIKKLEGDPGRLTVGEIWKAADRIRDLSDALNLALAWLVQYEPGDSRAVSNEFVAMAAVLCDNSDDDCRSVIASAIEARRAADSEAGAVEDESAAPKADAQQNPEPSQ